MPEFVSTQEDLHSLRCTLEELEEVIVDIKADILLDSKGALEAVNGDDMKEILFTLHKRRVGYRPDDPKAMRKAQLRLEVEERKAKEVRERERGKLVRRVAARKAARTRREGKP